MHEARIALGRVTHLVTVSCSGFYAPGFDISLVKRLPLQAGVARTHIGFMGCQGALNGLRRRVPLSTRVRRPVFCSVPLNFAACITSTVGTPTRSWPTPFFADGAAAAVAVGGESTRLPLYQVIASGSTVIGDSEDVMTWRIGDHGFEMTLSPRVPDLICEYLKPWLESWMAEHELDMARLPLVGGSSWRPTYSLGRL